MFFEVLKNKDYILRYIILLPIMIMPAFLILAGNKTAIGVIAVLILVFFYCGMISKLGIERANKYILYFIIFSIPFPYLINFMGKDAITITTMAIFLMFSVLVINSLTRKHFTRIEPKFALVFPIVIFFSFTISFLMNPHFIGQSIRHYLDNISGILLFFIMVSTIKKQTETIQIIRIFLFVLILQSSMSFLQWNFPGVGEYFSAFGTRTLTPGAILVGGFTRATGTIWDYELLAEWFLIGSILSVALIYIEKKYTYFFPLFCSIAGILFTKTRSDIILFAFAIMLIYLLLAMFRKDYKGKSIKIVLIIIFIGMLSTFIFPEQVSEFSQRLEGYFNSDNLISAESINRKTVWEDATKFYLRRLTFFGKGLYKVSSLGYLGTGSFHSLYLTLLYKTGIFGLLMHILFWLKMLQGSWSALANRIRYRSWYLLFFLFICLILMLVDGIKIEYLRYGHTIQFVWMMYALLIIVLKQSRDNSENTLVS